MTRFNCVRVSATASGRRRVLWASMRRMQRATVFPLRLANSRRLRKHALPVQGRRPQRALMKSHLRSGSAALRAVKAAYATPTAELGRRTAADDTVGQRGHWGMALRAEAPPPGTSDRSAR